MKTLFITNAVIYVKSIYYNSECSYYSQALLECTRKPITDWLLYFLKYIWIMGLQTNLIEKNTIKKQRRIKWYGRNRQRSSDTKGKAKIHCLLILLWLINFLTMQFN